MHTLIVLLRGINVGGKNKLIMKDLARILESLKMKDVQTYIQSGNVIARSSRKPSANLPVKIADAVETEFGFRPAVMLLSKQQLLNAAAENPFTQAEDLPKTLHLFFLQKPAKQSVESTLENARKDREQFVLTDKVFYLHAPDGIGRSKLAANAEKLLGVTTTARNWRTVLKLKEMAIAASD